MEGLIGLSKSENSDMDAHILTGGTIAANTITCGATFKAIECLEKTNAIERAGNIATILSKDLNGLFEQYNLPFFTYNFKSILHLKLSGFFMIDIQKRFPTLDAL